MNPHRIIAEARSWCGTPFHPAAAVKGAGCDCYGLVVGVWAAVTGEAVPPLPCVYQPERTLLRRIQEQMFTHLRQIAAPVPLVATAPGDVLLFAPDGRTVVHCGILSAPDRFIHSLNEGVCNQVRECRFTDRWRGWHVQSWRFQEGYGVSGVGCRAVKSLAKQVVITANAGISCQKVPFSAEDPGIRRDGSDF